MRGATAVRLFWGTVQEPSSIATLQALFPHVTLEEVGMYRAAYPLHGRDPKELPALGASPDAVMRHRLPVFAQDVAEGLQLLRQLRGNPHADVNNVPCWELAAARGAADLDGVTAAGTARQPLSACLPDAMHGSSVGDQDVARVASAILWRLLSESLTSNSAFTHPSTPSAKNAGAPGSGGAAVSVDGGDRVDLLSLQHSWHDSVQQVCELLAVGEHSDNANASLTTGKGDDATNGDGKSDQPLALVDVREAVEVKNHSPFAFRCAHFHASVAAIKASLSAADVLASAHVHHVV
eukprot:363901-Chlamydomonas_euryale.AAC.21